MQDTKLRILETGLRLWRADQPITARRIARELDLTHGAVCYHSREWDGGLRDMIAYHAVEQGEAKVIVALIAENHKHVRHMTNEEKQKYFNILSHG